MPKISVIMPVYRVEKYLNECIDSIINQTLQDIEIILIDDGSPDNCPQICDEYAQKDSRIKVFHQNNYGAANARNFGIKNATGKFLLILDSDDVFSPDLCQKLYKEAIKYNNDITICHSVEFDNNTNKEIPSDWIIKDFFLPEQHVFNYKDMSKHIIGFCQGWAWDKLYKTSFIRKHNLKFQNLKCTNDMYFVMLSLILAERISVIDDVLIKHRQNNFSSISNSRDKNPYCFIKAIYALKSTLEQKNLYMQVKQSFINWNVEFCFWHLDTLKNTKNKKKLLRKIKNEVFNKLEIYSLDANYFYKKATYERIQYIKSLKNDTWYQKIFSIRNDDRKTHKIITILGLKFKFKKRRSNAKG